MLRTFKLGIEPRNSIWSCNRSRSTISSRAIFFYPSPPMIKPTLGHDLHILRITLASKSTPLQYTNLEITTTFTLSYVDAIRCKTNSLSGWNLILSIAFGTAWTKAGSIFALNIEFSWHVWLTQIITPTVDNIAFITWFKITDARSSSTPKREWCV